MKRTLQTNGLGRARLGLMPVLGGVFTVLLLLGLAREGRSLQAAPDAPLSGPDLTAEILIHPSSPDPGEPTTLTFRVINKGSVGTGANVQFYYYINPETRPPYDAVTPRESSVPPLQPAGQFGDYLDVEIDVTFDEEDVGCDNALYIWVDPNNLIDETDQTNNRIEQVFCVGVECELDDYESDDSAQAAGSIALGTTQARSFCRDLSDGLTSAGDQDWVKFTAFAGLTYTLATSATANISQHADPRVVVYEGGLNQAVGGPAPAVSWQPPANGLYYAQIFNAEAADGSGPLTRYDLALRAEPGVTDDFEPDDTCGQAREIPTNGTRQTRLFQTPGDVDWIKFSVGAGESFAILADNTASGVNPIITLFDSCQQALGPERVAQGTARVEARSEEERVYYAHVTNQNAERFGPDAHYDLSVVATACTPDAFEDDDSFGQAKALALDEVQTRNFCPAGDQDWVQFELEAGEIYVVKTANLGTASDTVLALYDADGLKLIENDDYDYVKASRIVYQPVASGTYYAMVRHHNPLAAGDDTRYDLTLEQGYCVPDEADAENGDNGPGDAWPVEIGGTPLERNFCADPLTLELGDQDWMRFDAVAGATYTIRTKDLGPNTDPIMRLYDRNGLTLLAEDDDGGEGLAAQIVFVPQQSGEYFVQVTQYNPRVVGREASYRFSIEQTAPPPTPTPEPPPPPVPTARPPELDPSDVQTLIVVNQARMETLHGDESAAAVLNRLNILAGHERVQGAILRLEENPAVAAAYAEWTADDAALADSEKANAVAETIRNAILSFHASAPALNYLVLVGDDRAIPFFRLPEGNLSKKENEYAADVASLTIQAALADDMILTDDYYAALEPDQRGGRELYLPHFSIGRLIQEPDEIMGIIDIFIDDSVIDAAEGRALITGYDFVIDSADLNRTILVNDGLSVDSVIGAAWPKSAKADALLGTAGNVGRYEWVSINGHSTHLASGVAGIPSGTQAQNADITAEEVLAAANDFVRTLVYSVGCHAGLNDADVLDLPQAFVARGANFVGNTGYGWGGGGIVFSEALMRNFTRSLAVGTSAEIGPALVDAKLAYVSRARTFGSYDAKILMQTTLYGLPMFEITSGGVFDDDNLFPDVEDSFTLPSPGAFGDDELAVGSFAFGVPGSFGSFGGSDDDPNYRTRLENARDGTMVFEAGAPVQPGYYRDLEAPGVGSLRGVVFLGGVYTDTVADAPLALAFNEYVDPDESPPAFESDGWYPSVPFAVQSSAFHPGVRDTAVLALGQYDPETGTQRVFDNMSFDTYYSDNSDRSLADVDHVDAVLDTVAGKGVFKVAATDVSGISRVVIAYTEGNGQWESADLELDEGTNNWVGEIVAGANTRYFVQVVDGAGNVAVDDNKGRYYPLQTSLPLVQGRSLFDMLYLPVVESE